MAVDDPVVDEPSAHAEDFSPVGFDEDFSEPDLAEPPNLDGAVGEICPFHLMDTFLTFRQRVNLAILGEDLAWRFMVAMKGRQKLGIHLKVGRNLQPLTIKPQELNICSCM